MDQIGSDDQDSYSVPPSSISANNFFSLPSSVPASSVLTDSNYLTPGFAPNDGNLQFPNYAFPFGLNAASPTNSEHLFAQVDEYLNRLEQNGVSDSLSDCSQPSVNGLQGVLPFPGSVSPSPPVDVSQPHPLGVFPPFCETYNQTAEHGRQLYQDGLSQWSAQRFSPAQQLDYEEPVQQPDYQQLAQQPDYQQLAQKPDYQQLAQKPDYQQQAQQLDYHRQAQQPDYQQQAQQPDQPSLAPQPDFLHHAELPDYQQHAQVYSPFGTTGFTYQETATEPAPTVETVQPPKPETSTTKPSFADVAKNKPSKTHQKPPPYRASSPRESPLLTATNNHHNHLNSSAAAKLKKIKSLRPGLRRNKQVPVSPPPEIKPDSRYGLDSFDDGQAEKENSKEGRNRQNSASGGAGSMSCDDKGASAAAAATTTASDTTPSSGGTKDKKQARTSRPNSAEPLYFDPRRIFETPPSSSAAAKPRGQQGHSEEFVPNNKQKIQSDKDKEKVKASVKGGSTKYINNDLRQNKKPSNVSGEAPPEAATAAEPEVTQRRQGDGRDGGRGKAKKGEGGAGGCTSSAKERPSRRQWTAGRSSNALSKTMQRNNAVIHENLLLSNSIEF